MISSVIADYTPGDMPDEWDLGELVAAMDALYGTGVTADELAGLEREAIVNEFVDDAADAYAEREKEIEGIQEGFMRELERYMVLQVVDTRWREHLENMDYMREGIHLRGMAQKDPLVEYRNEGHVMFLELEPRDPRGGARAALPRAARAGPSRRAERRGGRSVRCPHRTAAPASSRYEHQTLAGADAIAAAGASTTTATAGGGGGTVATRPVVKTDEQSVGRNDPVLVRLGQEVQALPRRLTGPRISHPRRALRPGSPRRSGPSTSAPGPASESTPGQAGRIVRAMAETSADLSEQLEEIRVQLAWVRDYL